jgi:hypothetical protein
MVGNLLHIVGRTSIFEMKLEAEVLRDILTLFSADEKARDRIFLQLHGLQLNFGF